MLSLHEHLTETHLIQYLKDNFPDIPESQRHSLMIGAVTGAQVAAKLFVVVERDRVSPDPQLRTRAINAGSALSHFVLGLTTELEIEQSTIPTYNDDAVEDLDDFPSIPPPPVEFSDLLLPVSLEVSNQDCDVVMSAAVAAGLDVCVPVTAAFGEGELGLQPASVVNAHHRPSEHGDDQRVTTRQLSIPAEELTNSLAARQRSLSETAARSPLHKRQSEMTNRPSTLESEDPVATLNDQQPYVPPAGGMSSGVTYRATPIEVLEDRKRKKPSERLNLGNCDETTITGGDLGPEPECSVDVGGSPPSATGGRTSAKSPRLSSTSYWRYRRPTYRDRSPRRYVPHRRDNLPPTRQITVTAEEFARFQTSRSQHPRR